MFFNIRRRILYSLLVVLGSGSSFFYYLRRFSSKSPSPQGETMKEKFPIDFQWPVQEPFLFCVHHDDLYPVGTKNLGVDKSKLSGRNMGQDFEVKDGFRMYHGEEVPGFPAHPHRGFETITVVRKGLVDHADSMGASGRYGQGDVQWMTAGHGVQHSEMFPLLNQDKENRLELFQIWLNLPKKSKMVKPHFTMFWADQIPQLELEKGKIKVQLIAGSFENKKSLQPPPDSWAADQNNEVQILLVEMKATSSFLIPKSLGPTHRSIYFFSATSFEVNGEKINGRTGAFFNGEMDTEIKNTGSDPMEFLILQARPMNEPIVQYGPFVMNSREEIVKTIEDYKKTQFGGWSWSRSDMVHGENPQRFAKFPDGKIEKPKV